MLFRSDNLLTVRTKQTNKSEDSNGDGEIIHKGISQRQFARSFTIADDVKEGSAELDECGECDDPGVNLNGCCEGFCENPQYVGNPGQDECYPCDFVYSTSTQLGFYFFREVKLDDVQIDDDDREQLII